MRRIPPISPTSSNTKYTKITPRFHFENKGLKFPKKKSFKINAKYFHFETLLNLLLLRSRQTVLDLGGDLDRNRDRDGPRGRPVRSLCLSNPMRYQSLVWRREILITFAASLMLVCFIFFDGFLFFFPILTYEKFNEIF